MLTNAVPYLPTATTGKIILAAVLLADGHQVHTTKQPCGPRCIWEYLDSPAARTLIAAYEAGEVLPIPQQDIWRAYRELTAEAKALYVGRIGGGR